MTGSGGGSMNMGGAGGASGGGGAFAGPGDIPMAGNFLGGQQGGGAGGGAAPKGGQQDLLNQTKGMQEMMASFNVQYMQLQQKMQGENRSFTAISNVMKTKHDTAKASINNVR